MQNKVKMVCPFIFVFQKLPGFLPPKKNSTPSNRAKLSFLFLTAWVLACQNIIIQGHGSSLP